MFHLKRNQTKIWQLLLSNWTSFITVDQTNLFQLMGTCSKLRRDWWNVLRSTSTAVLVPLLMEALVDNLYIHYDWATLPGQPRLMLPSGRWLLNVVPSTLRLYNPRFVCPELHCFFLGFVFIWIAELSLLLFLFCASLATGVTGRRRLIGITYCLLFSQRSYKL